MFKISFAHILSLVLASIFYFYEVILRVSPSVMTEQLMEHFQISATALGFLSTSYYISYSILQIPGGMIIDRFGPRRVITLSTLICVIGTLIFCSQDNFYLAMLGRALIGVGSACAFISCLRIATDNFKPHYFPLIVGLANMMGTLGATFSSKPLAIIVNQHGWQNACIYLALTGLVLMPAIWIFVKDNKKENSATSFLEAFKNIAQNKQIWLLGIIAGFLFLPVTAFAELWGVPYIMKVYGIDNQEASKATVMIFIGAAIGSPIFPYIAHTIKSYKKALFLCAGLVATLFTLIAFAYKFSYIQTFFILFLAGFVIGAEILVFTIARNITADKYNATAMGFINALISFAGLIFQPILGKILDISWSGEIAENGVRIYSLENYQYAILVLVAMFIISFIMLFFLKDNYSKTA